MPRSRRVELGWEHPESGEEFRVVCSVSPGSPGRGPDLNGPGEPPEAPEVEVLEVVEDRPGGQERPELVALVEKAFAAIEERALEKANEDAASEHEDAEEHRFEERREEGYLW